MIDIIKTAGLVTLVEGAASLYVALVSDPFEGPVAASCESLLGCHSTFSQSVPFAFILATLGAVLLTDGLVAVWGARFALAAGVVFSAIVFFLTGFGYISDSQAIVAGTASYISPAKVTLNEIVLVLLAAAAVVSNAVALRSRRTLPEQVNPMNLPVFG